MRIDNEKWLVKEHLRGIPDVDRIYEKATESLDVDLQADEMLLETRYVSVDPYLHGITLDTPIGNCLGADTVMEVIEAGPKAMHAVGDFVQGFGGWQRYVVSDGREALWQTGTFPMVFPAFRKLDPAVYGGTFSPSTSLSVLGGSGMTAWGSVSRILNIEPGQTLIISGASGVVGTLVGQLAKLRGARVIGIAGSAGKLEYLSSLGFDGGINYREADTFEKMLEAVDEVAPDGVDRYFDNIGGYTTDAIFNRLNVYSIVAICWQMAIQTGVEPRMGPRLLDLTMFSRTTIRGIFSMEWFTDECWAELIDVVGGYIQDGSVRYDEIMHHGFDAIPSVYQKLFVGTEQNMGKLMVTI